MRIPTAWIINNCLKQSTSADFGARTDQMNQNEKPNANLSQHNRPKTASELGATRGAWLFVAYRNGFEDPTSCAAGRVSCLNCVAPDT
jgi:hypothetical protein